MPGTYDRKDRFYERAKEEKYASRAVYKLQELDRQFKLFKMGQRVLDLGCAPGSWMQWIAGKTGPQGLVVGVDLLPVHISLGATMRFLQGDFSDEVMINQLAAYCEDSNPPESPFSKGGNNSRPALFDVIVSDSAPNLSGILFADQERSLALNRQVMATAKRLLKPKGKLVLKSFEGEAIQDLKAALIDGFVHVQRFIPEATRKTSREVYWIAEKK